MNPVDDLVQEHCVFVCFCVTVTARTESLVVEPETALAAQLLLTYVATFLRLFEYLTVMGNDPDRILRFGLAHVTVKVIAAADLAIDTHIEGRTIRTLVDLVLCAMSAEKTSVQSVEKAVRHIVSERSRVLDSVVIDSLTSAVNHPKQLEPVVEVNLPVTRLDIAAVNDHTSCKERDAAANCLERFR